jgi:hypothetical protein
MDDQHLISAAGNARSGGTHSLARSSSYACTPESGGETPDSSEGGRRAGGPPSRGVAEQQPPFVAGVTGRTSA